MPRIILTTDPTTVPEAISVLLDERVSSVHLSTDHAASQLIERIAWAIADAEDAELSASGGEPSAPAPTPASRPRAARRRGTPQTSRLQGALTAR
jgi:hypothetical protein